MSHLSFLQGLETNLVAMSQYTPGAVYFTTDTHKFYIGLSETECVPLNSFEADSIKNEITSEQIQALFS